MTAGPGAGAAPATTEELLGRWLSDMAALSGAAGPAVVTAGRGLLARYREPHRRYHDARHLGEVLAALDLLGSPVPPVVACAAFHHDAVYDAAYEGGAAVAQPGNEQRSADLAAATLPALGVPTADVAEVVRLVLLTQTHRATPGDLPGALLCDADLAVLGSPPERYAHYARQVREEYAHVPDEAFRRGRAAVLRNLLALPTLFATAAGRARWEQPARHNVTAEVRRLTAAGGDAARRP